MTDQTLNLALPYILASQSDKHVSFNAAMDVLDVASQLTVASRIRSSPPTSPNLGESWIVAAAPSGEWTGHSGEVATLLATGWQFLSAQVGWRAWDETDNVELVFAHGTWSPAIGQGQIPKLGIKTPADTTNVLAVSGPAILFTADASHHIVKINKATSNASGTLAFQTGYSTRAEIGLAGNDKLTIKVSADGSSFVDAVTIDQTSGAVGIGVGSPTCALHINGAVRVRQFVKASLPAASTIGAGGIIYVDDDGGGPILAFSDGTAWRRVTDRAVIA